MEFRELLTDCRNRKFPAKAQRRKENKESEFRPALLLCFQLRLRRALTEKKSQYNPWQLFFASLRLCGKFLLAFSLTLVALAQPRRPMTPADILRIATVAVNSQNQV